ncbi:prealbumin-like fold domain-containing protein, partial [Oscillospiraceae bacterium OttesenSCG-928-F05]|nr:prealbumin-like fold domain-containing protein [Oscillospiraceae bacterium OttesenSCG-928-F05]
SVTGEGIPGVTFLLYDGSNNPLGQYESDQDGYVYIGYDGGLPEGKYKIRELQPGKGYIGDEQVRTVYLEYGRTTEIRWENTRELGQIIVTKRSASFNETTNLPAGSPLSGAVFEVYSVTGNLVARMVSGSNGVAASQPIPLGVYVVKEVTPPKYYALNTRELLADIRHNGDIVRFEVLDENVDLGVTIQKKSQNQIAQNQMIIWDLFGIANNSSAALENFYVHDRLPTDATRGAKVFTGTWSHNLTYRVTYKTNYSTDYKVLASGLSTKTNYELSIHTNVLGLQSGEYVTDIRWEFGTVPAGFKSETNPKIQAQVLATLPKGYKIVNRADVGGLYIGQWITAQTSWTTLIYSDPAPAPQLPKTGY